MGRLSVAGLLVSRLEKPCESADNGIRIVLRGFWLVSRLEKRKAKKVFRA